jgi:hypothetical protein
MALDGQAEETVDRSFRLLLARGLVSPGDLVVVVSDMTGSSGGSGSADGASREAPEALFSVDEDSLGGLSWEDMPEGGGRAGPGAVRSIQVRYVPQPNA